MLKPLVSWLALTFAQVFGRAEMFTLSILFQAIGYAIYAACKNVSQYIVSV